SHCRCSSWRVTARQEGLPSRSHPASYTQPVLLVQQAAASSSAQDTQLTSRHLTAILQCTISAKLESSASPGDEGRLPRPSHRGLDIASLVADTSTSLTFSQTFSNAGLLLGNEAEVLGCDRQKHYECNPLFESRRPYSPVSALDAEGALSQSYSPFSFLSNAVFEETDRPASMLSRLTSLAGVWSSGNLLPSTSPSANPSPHPSPSPSPRPPILATAALNVPLPASPWAHAHPQPSATYYPAIPFPSPSPSPSLKPSPSPSPAYSVKTSVFSSLGSLPMAQGAQGILWPVLPCHETADFLAAHPCPRAHRYFTNQQGQVVLAGASRVRSPINQTLLRWAKLDDLPPERQPIADLMPMLQAHQVQVGINPFSLPPPSINPDCYDDIPKGSLTSSHGPAAAAGYGSSLGASIPSSVSTLSSFSSSSSSSSSRGPGWTPQHGSSKAVGARMPICCAPPPLITAIPPDILLLARYHPEELSTAMVTAVLNASHAAAEAASQRCDAGVRCAAALSRSQLAHLQPPLHGLAAGLRAAAAATAAGVAAAELAGSGALRRQCSGHKARSNSARRMLPMFSI
ncbi:hypothetical protein V8C86DRAFT_342905, partial [Haematococcus lacustris]